MFLFFNLFINCIQQNKLLCVTPQAEGGGRCKYKARPLSGIRTTRNRALGHNFEREAAFTPHAKDEGNQFLAQKEGSGGS